MVRGRMVRGLMVRGVMAWRVTRAQHSSHSVPRVRRMFLNGTAMSGQPDHAAITGATFLGPARTAPFYRFFTARDAFPGLFPVSTGGANIEGELYELPEEMLYDSLMPEEPQDLDLGAVLLD